jgi:hypothetical protein
MLMGANMIKGAVVAFILEIYSLIFLNYFNKNYIIMLRFVSQYVIFKKTQVFL